MRASTATDVLQQRDRVADDGRDHLLRQGLEGRWVPGLGLSDRGAVADAVNLPEGRDLLDDVARLRGLPERTPEA